MREDIEKLREELGAGLVKLKPSLLIRLCEALLALDARLTKIEKAADGS